MNMGDAGTASSHASPRPASVARSAKATNTTRIRPAVPRAMETAASANAAQARMNVAPSVGDNACQGTSSRLPNSTTQASCEHAMSREVRVADVSDASIIASSPVP